MSGIWVSKNVLSKWQKSVWKYYRDTSNIAVFSFTAASFLRLEQESFFFSHAELRLEPSSTLPAALSFWLDKSSACFRPALLWHARCDHVLFLLAFASKWLIWAGPSAQPTSKKSYLGHLSAQWVGLGLSPTHIHGLGPQA